MRMVSFPTVRPHSDAFWLVNNPMQMSWWVTANDSINIWQELPYTGLGHNAIICLASQQYHALLFQTEGYGDIF